MYVSLNVMHLLTDAFSQLYETRQEYQDATEREDHLHDQLREHNIKRQVKELVLSFMS